jgi:hypothetical protein
MDAINIRPGSLLRRGALAAVLASGALGAAGCDEVTGLGSGDFLATITGDVEADLAGDAYWTIVEEGGESTFMLILFQGDINDNDRERYHFVSISRSGARPGVGVYSVDNDEPNPPAFRGQYADLTEADEPEAAGPVLGATGGVFTVTRVESGLMTGSFRFDASGLMLPDTGMFISGTLDGTFDARFLDPDVLTGLGIPFGLD